MIVTTLYLVRHAHASWTPDEGRSLSAEGRAAASHVAALLRDEPIRAVYASTPRRAVQTVEPLAELLGLTVTTVKKLRERRLSGEPVDDHGAAVAWCWANPGAALPGGESNLEARRRGVAVIDELASRHAGEAVVVGTHGNLLALILQQFQPVVDYAFWSQLTMPDIYALTLRAGEPPVVTRLWDASDRFMPGASG
jgi:2,3-bisphosphoglycerate-dependent phosphoglycerate mutase